MSANVLQAGTIQGYAEYPIATAIQHDEQAQLDRGRTTKVRFANGMTKTICLDDHFKSGYKDEYTRDVLPDVQLRDAMLDELD